MFALCPVDIIHVMNGTTPSLFSLLFHLSVLLHEFKQKEKA